MSEQRGRQRQQGQEAARYLLCSSEVLQKGLSYLGAPVTNKASRSTREWYFEGLYGSSSRALAVQWYALMTTRTDAKLNEKDASEEGFRAFLLTHNFLWRYSTARELAVHWGQCERLSRGEPLWRWVRKIAALKEEHIVWDCRLDREDTETFIISVDGTDYRAQEKSNEELNVDKKQYSKKFNHGGLKYEIAVGIASGKVVWVSGPHRGGKNDQTIFQEGLQAKIKAGKLAIADGGYSGPKVSVPNRREPKEVRQFKARVRARHETLNGRLKNFKILSETYRHNSKEKHGLAFDAIVVTVNMQIETGNQLFQV